MVNIRERAIDEEDNLKYLGKRKSFEERMEKELKERRKTAWNSYRRLKNVYLRK